MLMTGLQEYLSLPAGSWTFQARATDLAGNVEGTASPSRPTKAWTVALPTPHAIITGGQATRLDSSFELFILMILILQVSACVSRSEILSTP